MHESSSFLSTELEQLLIGISGPLIAALIVRCVRRNHDGEGSGLPIPIERDLDAEDTVYSLSFSRMMRRRRRR